MSQPKDNDQKRLEEISELKLGNTSLLRRGDAGVLARKILELQENHEDLERWIKENE